MVKKRKKISEIQIFTHYEERRRPAEKMERVHNDGRMGVTHVQGFN